MLKASEPRREGRDWEMPPRALPCDGGAVQAASKAGEGQQTGSLLELQKDPALPTPPLQPAETDFRPLTSRTTKE